jgi:hypothetical protein
LGTVPPGRLLGVALVAALTVTGCSGGGDSATKKKDDTEASSAEFTRASVRLAVSKAELVSPHQKIGPLEQNTTDDVVAVVQQLLLVTSAQPLVEGKARGTLTDLFTKDAAARATGHDRSVFFDDGLPRFGTLTPVASRVRLTGLAGTQDPSTALVIARFLWDVTSKAHPANRVTRDGELSFVKVGHEWRIGAYAITATRTVDGATTTTTASTTTTTGKDSK